MNITTFIDEAIHDTCAVDDEPDSRTIVKTRKPHECGFCGRIIPAGERAAFYEGRAPRYDSDYNKQIGIEYYREWTCEDYDACLARYEEREQ